jgi:hypothetical protein
MIRVINLNEEMEEYILAPFKNISLNLPGDTKRNLQEYQ